MSPTASAIRLQGADEQQFREVLGHFASGVVAVTGVDSGGRPLGLTVTSFTSVSLAPPLVSFCVARTSRTWPKIHRSDGVCINILSDQQQDLSASLARSGEGKFGGIGWSMSAKGLPLLNGALSWLECQISAEHPAGDHNIVVTQVQRLAASDLSGPLLRYRGSYGRLAGLGPADTEEAAAARQS